MQRNCRGSAIGVTGIKYYWMDVQPVQQYIQETYVRPFAVDYKKTNGNAYNNFDA